MSVRLTKGGRVIQVDLLAGGNLGYHRQQAMRLDYAAYEKATPSYTHYVWPVN